jgi:hypothetical protein
MFLDELETEFPGSERPYTLALECSATGVSTDDDDDDDDDDDCDYDYDYDDDVHGEVDTFDKSFNK